MKIRSTFIFSLMLCTCATFAADMSHSAKKGTTIMKEKTQESIQVLYATEYLTIPEIGKWGEIIHPLVMAEVKKYGLKVSGPWIFIAYGRDGNMNTQFVHEYCLPVEGIEKYKGTLKTKTLPAFRCGYINYKGDTSQKMMGSNGYDPLIKSIIQAGYSLTGESREVYHTWISPESKENEFEIQFGIK